jgi:hypothetical protein
VNDLANLRVLLSRGATSDQQDLLNVVIEQALAKNALPDHTRRAEQYNLHVRIITQNSNSELGKKPFTIILHCRINDFHLQLDFAVFYFDQEKVLIPMLYGEQHRRFELSPELKSRFFGRLSDSAERSLWAAILRHFRAGVLLVTLLCGCGAAWRRPHSFLATT